MRLLRSRSFPPSGVIEYSSFTAVCFSLLQLPSREGLHYHWPKLGVYVSASGLSYAHADDERGRVVHSLAVPRRSLLHQPLRAVVFGV